MWKWIEANGTEENLISDKEPVLIIVKDVLHIIYLTCYSWKDKINKFLVNNV